MPILKILGSAARAVADGARDFVAPFRGPAAPPRPPTPAYRAVVALKAYVGPAPSWALQAAYEAGCSGAMVGTANGGLGVRGSLSEPLRARLYDAGFTRVLGDGPEEWIWLGPDR